MRIAIEGCAHGELEKIYATIAALEANDADGKKVDLLLCCGDFQATRNLGDLECMAVPRKFHDMCSFYKYYSGELRAPILTVFIGGNHEASNYMQELPYGGWVAPNIYYLGYAGCVRVNGVRIAGLSGIFKGYNYHRGHHEIAPYDDNAKKSVYHVRQLNVFRLQQLSGPLDVCLSHDWPRGVYNFGNAAQLCRFKPHFADEIADNRLGSGPAEELLQRLRPAHWFSAHLHCKFAAVVPHRGAQTSTRFLALDKCLPQRRFLQVLDLEGDDGGESGDRVDGPPVLSYDLEWLAILQRTNHLLSVKATTHYMPGPGGAERHDFTPTADELELVRQKLGGDLRVPQNFVRTAAPYVAGESAGRNQQPAAQLNPQTTELCERLGLDDPVSLLMVMGGGQLRHATYREEERKANEAEGAAGDTAEEVQRDDEKDEPTAVEIRQRSAFVLPEPVQSDGNPDLLELNDDEADDFNDSVEEEVNNETSLASPATESDDIIVSTSDAQKIETTEDSVRPGPAISNTDAEPPTKVFKRRNEAIYAMPAEE